MSTTGKPQRKDHVGSHDHKTPQQNKGIHTEDSTLEITNLHASTKDGNEILKGISLIIKSGEIHAVMGPNGSGKSTLCKVLMGHPGYKVTKGSIKLNGGNIMEMEPNKRANLGIFLGFQHPLEIPGITLSNFLRLAKNANRKANGQPSIPPREFLNEMKTKTEILEVDPKFINRSVNEGCSGGERKRAEIIQMSVLEPKIAILDEIDSGLDIDALKTVAKTINKNFRQHNTGILLITHYQRILNHIRPHFVHIIQKGEIIKSGDAKLAKELEKKGYAKFTG